MKTYGFYNTAILIGDKTVYRFIFMNSQIHYGDIYFYNYADFQAFLMDNPEYTTFVQTVPGKLNTHDYTIGARYGKYLQGIQSYNDSLENNIEFYDKYLSKTYFGKYLVLYEIDLDRLNSGEDYDPNRDLVLITIDKAKKLVKSKKKLNLDSPERKQLFKSKFKRKQI